MTLLTWKALWFSKTTEGRIVLSLLGFQFQTQQNYITSGFAFYFDDIESTTFHLVGKKVIP